MITVTQRPYQTINGADAKWNAVGNPVLYKMQRKDFTFNQVNDSSGFIQLQFNSADLTTSFTVGDLIYIKSDNSVYDLFASVTARSFSTNTLVTVDAAYISAAPGGFVNNDDLRSLYKVEVEVYNSDDEPLSESAFSYSPDNKGELIINVSAVLRANMNADNGMDLTADTIYDNVNAYVNFYIKYREVWVGSAESQTDDVANQFYASFSARQIPSLYGGNMTPYVLRSYLDTDGLSDSGDWSNQGSGVDWTIGGTDLLAVTVLEFNPSKRARKSISISQGDVIAIGFDYEITEDPLTGLTAYLGGTQAIQLFTVPLSAGTGTITLQYGVALADYTYIEIIASTDNTETTLFLNNAVIINTNTSNKFLTKFDSITLWPDFPCLISAIVGDDIHNFSAISFKLGLEEPFFDGHAGALVDIDLSRIYNAGVFTPTTTTLRAFLDAYLYVSETLTVNVKSPCKNPIMLLGRNTLGGALCWVFDVVQEYTFDYGNDIKSKRMILYADGLTMNQWEALQDFFTLGKVYKNNIIEFTSSVIKSHTRIGQQVYTVDTDGNKIGVIVIPTKNRTSTNKYTHDFEIEIEFPNTIVP